MNTERLYELLDDVEDKHAEPRGKQRIELGEELLHKSAESHDYRQNTWFQKKKKKDLQERIEEEINNKNNCLDIRAELQQLSIKLTIS